MEVTEFIQTEHSSGEVISLKTGPHGHKEKCKINKNKV